MNLSTMRALVRRDLKDEDAQDYRWTDDEIDRAIHRAVAELSRYIPREVKSTIATANGSREIDISSLTDRISVDRVEFPVGESPRVFQRFSVYGDVLTLISEYEGDGNDAYVYWSQVHTLDASTSTIPAYLEDVVALGAAAYAIQAQAQYSSNRANTGGQNVDRDYSYWAEDALQQFQDKLRLNGRKRKLQISKLYEGSDKE
jgi:hypothetical protein